MPSLKVFTCTNFTGFYPVGVSALSIAASKEDAMKSLNDRLRSEGLKGDCELSDLEEIPLDRETSRILNNGDY